MTTTGSPVNSRLISATKLYLTSLQDTWIFVQKFPKLETHQVGLYADACFRSQPRHLLIRLRFFMSFLRVNCVTLGMYSEGSQFESQLGHQLCLLRFFHGFSWSPISNAGLIPQAIFYGFFSIHLSSICLTLYCVTTESVINTAPPPSHGFLQSFHTNSRIVPQISLGGHHLPHSFKFIFHQSS